MITPVLASGEKVLLRDPLPTDLDSYVHWQTHGEWRMYDAPWEGVRTSMTPEQEEKVRQGFLDQCSQVRPALRWSALIATVAGNRPLGWVSRYANDRFPNAWFVGINICDDAALNRGLGTEALALWVDYLFANSTMHRLGLDTWSFNPRMMRVAEKAGFGYEGRQRELIEWQGRWLDWVHYGLLRSVWEEKRGKLSAGG
jgi:RimJ/RimL family protein N-acetyltransferase